MASSANLFQSRVRAVLSSASEAEERHALEALRDHLANDGHAWTSSNADGGGAECLGDSFMLYAFVRAFAPSSSSQATIFKKEALATAMGIPALARAVDVSALTQQLLGQLYQAPLKPELLARLANTIQQIEDPRVRQHAIQFAYSVLKVQGGHDASEEVVRETSRVLLLGITDVWSAVRKQSARAVVEIAFQFPALHQVDAFVGSLLKLAGGSEWKAQEGALLALTTIVASIEAVPSADQTLVPTKHQAEQRAADMIKGGSTAIVMPFTTMLYHVGDRHRALPHLPHSLTLKLKPTLYSGIKTDQLSVREAAAQCFVHYMEICDESTRVLSFQEVMSKLNWLSPETADDVSSTNSNAELLDAAEAEGLLDVLARLVPCLPVIFLVKHWKVVFPTLERYVMHIASTVRLRSSSVVLALAELSLAENVHAIELLYQVLLALAERRLDTGVGWQRLEGRLLSIDLLVGLLGKDCLWRVSNDQNLLRFVSPSRPHQSVARDAWLPMQLTVQATWTLDEDEEQRFHRAQTSSCASIIQRLGLHAESKALSPSELWQRALSGWFLQTREAFDSPQFELRRIARQLLPGLVRLSLWCGQFQLYQAANTGVMADTKTCKPLDAWTWVCLRHAVLHAQYVRESSGFLWKEGKDWTTKPIIYINDTLQRAPRVGPASKSEPEAVVARVEAILLTMLSQSDRPQLAFVTCAIRDVHSSIPLSCQHPLAWDDPTVSTPRPTPDGTLDRQFSIALVTLLPTIVRRLVLKSGDVLLWRMVARVALSWLVTDDMFRWIAIDKATAQVALLLALSELLAAPVADEALASDDVSSILRTLETVVPMATQPRQRAKDCVSTMLVRIYASLWRTPCSTRDQQKIILALACLHHQRCQPVAAVKPMVSPKSDWDDWDGDDVDPKHETLRPAGVLQETEVETPVQLVAWEVISHISPEQLEHLVAELWRLVDTEAAGRRRDAVQSFAASVSTQLQQGSAQGLCQI